jgi:NADH:ubiquinone oxidoreductase subunit K
MRIAVTELPILLCQGQVGMIIDVLKEGTAFEVEFSDLDGQAYAMLTVKKAAVTASVGIALLIPFNAIASLLDIQYSALLFPN